MFEKMFTSRSDQPFYHFSGNYFAVLNCLELQQKRAAFPKSIESKLTVETISGDTIKIDYDAFRERSRRFVTHF